MPYVKQALRAVLETQPPTTSGELNYVMTKAIWGFLKDKGITYDSINTCIGALECAKMEMYRRVAAGYEDDKRIENGDVYK